MKMHVTAAAFAALTVTAGAGLVPSVLLAQEERQRRNLFGMHTLNSGNNDFVLENLEWTRHLVGRGWVFDYPRNGNYEALVEKAFELDLIPCIRVQEGEGGDPPSAAAAQVVAEKILNYKIAHPEYADRLVYLQLWNEPNDRRDFVPPEAYADYLVEAHNGIHQAEAMAAAAHPELGLLGTIKTMTPGQNGPSWWDQAFRHNPDAKFAFDVWATHPYPEAAPPHYNHHDGDVFIETTKTIDSYLLDLDMVARPHGSPPRSRRGFPVMITETAYGDKLGISYEGWPKTNRTLAAEYNVDAFAHRWYRWPELLAVHPFLLHHPAWERFAWVPGSSCGAPASPACTSEPACSEECDGDGVREPKGPHPQYSAVRQLRLSLESQGMAPARHVPFRGPTGRIRGRVTRADTGAVVPYATVRTDGYAFGHVSLYDGVYEIHDVPAGSYTLSVEKNGYRASSRPVTVSAGQTTTADFGLVHTGRVSKGIYFIDSPPHPGCPGCSLWATVLGQTFTTPADVAFVKYAASKPNVDGVTLRFSILDGGPTGPQLGTSVTATLEKGDGANMIGAEWPDGQEPAVQPDRTYFLKIERADGQGLYGYASNANPYPAGTAYVGGQPLAGVDFLAVIRGLTASVNTATGALGGSVRDESGASIAGAAVATSPGGRSATTDDAGRYAIGGVAVGIYQVTASRSGFVSATTSGVEVREDATTTVDFTLTAGATSGSLRGRVTDASGQPLPGAQVTVTPGGRLATTDALGAYLVDDLAAGQYSVEAARAGYVPQTKTGIAVAAGATTTLDFELAAAPVAPSVANPDFEDDHGFFGVARSWTAFGGNKWEAVWDPARVFTQGVTDVPPSSRAGVFQTIALAPRTRYRVTVHVKVTGAGHEAAVGVNAGGTGAGAAVFGAASTSPSWTAVSTEFEATGGAATIVLGARNTNGAFVGGWVQFDGVAIQSLGPAATAARTALESTATAAAASSLSWSSDAFEEFDYRAGYGQVARAWSPWFENTDPGSPGEREWNIVPGESAWAQELRKSRVRMGLFRGNSGFAAGGTYLVKFRARWLTGGGAAPVCSVGIHPAGGTNPAEVTWAAGVPVASKGGFSDVSGQLTVPGASATVFTRCDYAGLNDYGVAIDNLTIQAVGNQPPAVSLSTDKTTATAPGTFVLTASASDPDGSVTRVEFFQGSAPLNIDTASPYTFTWSGVGVGAYGLTARAYDDSGASAVSDAVTVTVTAPGNQPPTVGLSADRTTATAPGTFVLTASASDPDGGVSRVEFLRGSTLLHTDTASPYVFTWSGVAAGTYSLTARAHDDAGATAVSNAVTVTVSASPPPSSKSKLSIHAGWGGGSDSFLRNARPRVVKILDEVGKAALVKQLSPGTIVVGRIFAGSVPDGVVGNGSPVDRANEWWNTVRATVLAHPDVDYWEGLNEPVVTSAQTMSWYAQFEIARTNILAAHGRRACIANFATGNPDLSLWPQFVPAIDNALARGGIMGLHEYGTPMTQYWEEPLQEGWLCGRYRRVYRQHLQGREIPLVITETGVDEGTLASTGPGQPKPRPIDAQANHGWQQALGTPPVAGLPPPGDLQARRPWYMDQLKWYDAVLKQDDYVLGATIFQLEIPGWGSFSVGPLLQELTDYVAQGAGNAAPTVSLSTDKTTAEAPGSFVLTASASDPDGGVARVEFFQGATLLHTDTTSPWSYTWSGVAAGSYSLTARAHDDAGASATSTAVGVTVTSGTPSPPPSPTDPGLVWLFDDMNAHDGGLVRSWSKWSTGTGSAEWNIVPGEGGWWAQEVKKSGVNVGISRPNRGFKAGDAYRLRFRARRTMGAGAPRAYAGVQSDGGAVSWSGPVLVSSTTSWVDVSYDFTASNASLTLLLRADLTGFVDVGVAFDNVRVELLSPRDPEPWMLSGAPPVEPLNIQGIHDPGAEDLFVQAGRRGWVTEALAIGSNPDDRTGRRFTEWIDGIGVVGRIAHLYGQILPDPGPAPLYPGLDAFATRAAHFVEASVGCGIWSIGNEPHLEGVPDPLLYAEAFARTYRAIKAVRPAARVITAGFVHGNVDYMRAALSGIEARGVLPDGIALHTYTDSQGWNEASFRDYRTKIASLPPSMSQLPLYITEAGTGGPGNPTTNTGLVNAMFNDVHQWNAAGGQQVRAVCVYRWTAGTDKWAIEANPGMRADFVASLAPDYRWFPGSD